MPSMYDADNYLYILCDMLQCNIINLISVFLFVCYFYSLGASCCQNLRLLCRVMDKRVKTMTSRYKYFDLLTFEVTAYGGDPIVVLNPYQV